MSINATTSSVGTTTSSSSVSNSQSVETQKSSTDSSFKDEMNKVSTSEKEDTLQKPEQKEEKTSKPATEEKSVENIDIKLDNNKVTEQKEAEASNLAALSMMNVNTLLSNDIEQMMVNNPTNIDIDENNISIYNTNFDNTSKGIGLDFTNIQMSESDAQFFIDLTQNNTVNTKTIIAQAQMALDNGVEFNQVQQNVKISETLLNAINTARETNQPLRIDFDQNIAVILRIGKDGSFAANFIPGDKVVEQYLKNNLETLKSTFDEKELPYTDLSYSNRGSKRQKEERNNQQ